MHQSSLVWCLCSLDAAQLGSMLPASNCVALFAMIVQYMRAHDADSSLFYHILRSVSVTLVCTNLHAMASALCTMCRMYDMLR